MNKNLKIVGAYYKRLNQGRLNRRDFIFGIIVNIISFFVIELLLGLSEQFILKYSVVGILGVIVFLFALNNWFSFATRRFHDLGKNGWYVALTLIPLVGFLVILWLLVMPGEDKENRFGIPQKNLSLKKIFAI